MKDVRMVLHPKFLDASPSRVGSEQRAAGNAPIELPPPNPAPAVGRPASPPAAEAQPTLGGEKSVFAVAEKPGHYRVEINRKEMNHRRLPPNTFDGERLKA